MKLSEIWAKPPASHSPVPIWWWSGEPLEINRLLKQLRCLASAGVHNVCIINLAPTSPLFNCDPDDPPFMSEAWWDIFTSVCAEAKRLDVRIWFYDQLGFSGANFQARLVRADATLAGWWLDVMEASGQQPCVQCPSGGQPLAAFEFQTENAPGVEIEIVDGVAKGAPGTTVRLVYTTRRGFDYFNPDACARLIDSVHGEFERRLSHEFGTTIAGSFQDELPAMPTWTDDFEKHFSQLCGYELRPNLASLFTGDDEKSRRVRLDFHRTRAELAQQAFFRPLHEFHERNDLLCGFDQTVRDGDPASTTAMYADYLRTHRWYSAPGSDHMGDAKIHSSLAHSYDRPRVWIEGFHSTGWGGSLAHTYDWLIPWLRAGATLYNPHAVYYSTRAGWWEWAAPSTCWRQPYFEHYKIFADASTRLCALLSEGSHVCDVAVLYPSATVQSGSCVSSSQDATSAASIYRELVGRMYWWSPQPGVLDRDRRDFDVLDPDIAANAVAANGRLTAGSESWRAVLLPGCSILDDAVADVLVEFVASGGTLVAVGCVPGSHETVAQLFTDGRATLVQNSDDVPAALSQVIRTVEADTLVLHRRMDNTEIIFVPASATGATVQDPTSRLWDLAHYTFDESRYAQTVKLSVETSAQDAQLWDPITGSRESLAITTHGDRKAVEIPMDGRPAAVVVFGHGDTVEAVPPKPSTTIWTAPNIWEATAIATIDNSDGDLAWPASEQIGVQTWTFNDDTVHATFAQHGTWTSTTQPEPQVAVWSTTRGIHKDELHTSTLGPKGHVPEEFLDFGIIEPGHTVVFTTTVSSDTERDVILGVGSSATKRVILDSVEVAGSGTGYMWHAPISLSAGTTALEIHFTVPTDAPPAPIHVPWSLRGFFTFASDSSAFDRPEWMHIAGDSVKGSRVRFTTQIHLPDEPTSATVQVGAEAACRLFINDVEVGRQGGFLPYAIPTVQPYDCSQLRAGRNDICIELTDIDRPTSVLCDMAVSLPDDTTQVFASGPDWTVTRDSEPPAPVSLRGSQLFDPPFAHLTRRPHPLPGSAWLDESDDRILNIEVGESQEVTTTLTWTLPPGATEAQIPLVGRATLTVDGEPIEIVDFTAVLPQGLLHQAELSVVGTRRDGAVLSGPISYRTSDGTLPLGDWTKLGLSCWSGAVSYRTTATLAQSGQPTHLDLGEVHGTAEVFINSRPAGGLICAPWRLDISEVIQDGENTVEVVVRNTLAPYLEAASPTRFIFPGQTSSGLIGPVRMTTGP